MNFDDILKPVNVPSKNIDDYISVVGQNVVNELKELAKKLKGKKILNLNATAYGGGVAELLNAQVSLMQSLGLDVEWRTISANTPFYEVTKKFHNTLQGNPYEITEQEFEIYLDTIKKNAEVFENSYDIVLAHDPQILALIDFVENKKGKWIFRCHIDTSNPNMKTWEFLYPYMKNYGVIFTLDEFVHLNSEFKNLVFIAPSIDPLSIKNREIDSELANALVEKFGINSKRPLICQVSRFDPWKDPLGVIDVYRDLKYENINFSKLQLALVGSMAHDDPEGMQIFEKTLRRAGEDNDIFILSNLHGVKDLEVNAFQRVSKIIIQKSIKEGFGLTVSEVMFKGTPVIAGNTGGIKLQIEDGVSGFLTSKTQEVSKLCAYLLNNPDIAYKIGEEGRKTVIDKFLCTREIKEHLELFIKLCA